MNLVAREYVKKPDKQVYPPVGDVILGIDSTLLAGKARYDRRRDPGTFEARVTQRSGWRKPRKTIA